MNPYHLLILYKLARIPFLVRKHRREQAAATAATPPPVAPPPAVRGHSGIGVSQGVTVLILLLTGSVVTIVAAGFIAAAQRESTADQKRVDREPAVGKNDKTRQLIVQLSAAREVTEAKAALGELTRSPMADPLALASSLDAAAKKHASAERWGLAVAIYKQSLELRKEAKASQEAIFAAELRYTLALGEKFKQQTRRVRPATWPASVSTSSLLRGR